VRYRIYFNRKEEAPQVWSVDQGNQKSEINVSSVTLQVPSVFRYSGGERNNDTPVAWAECDGTLFVIDGEAVIR
jgi:hypothetical protein